MAHKNPARAAGAMMWRMPRRSEGGEPLYRQVESLIRGGIVEGRLRIGDRIPSVSDLSQRLGVNKVTVVRAFQELERAGVLTSHVGRGTFVAAAAREGGAGGKAEDGSPAAVGRTEVQRAVRRLRESFAGGLRELLSLPRPPGTINLGGGVPPPDTVHEEVLAHLTRAALAEDPRRLFSYGGATGLPELREEISRWLRHQGYDVAADQVIVTNGSQQAVMLLACWALDEGRGILCETPTFTGTPSAFAMVGHAVESVPWRGASLDLAPRAATASARRSLLYCCPDHHNPTGQSFDREAREQLAAWTAQGDRIVIVDEIFRDLRFDGEAQPGLYGLLPPGRRVLIGSLSKNFMTGLRAGFLVADQPLIQDLGPFKRHLDLGSPALTQAVAARWLADGHAAHLERVREHYRVRCRAAIAALEKHMPEGVRFTRPEGGFQLWVELPGEASSVDLYLRALERGVAISPGPVHDIDGRYQNCFRLGYGHASPGDLSRSIEILGRTVEELLARKPVRVSATGLGLLV